MRNYQDIQSGDFHIHTNYTDGENTVDEYCRRAQHNGLKVVAFTEHVRQVLGYSFDNLLLDIVKARAEFPQLSILTGCETKVLSVWGNLDAPKSVLCQCDIVVGVFHSFQDRQNYPVALKAMLRNPVVDIWGHPDLFAVEDELEDIVDICVEESVLIERNLRYNVPNAGFIKLALSKGAKFVVGSDAHSIDGLPTIQRLTEEWGWINKMC